MHFRYVSGIISRSSHHYLTPVGRQPNDRRLALCGGASWNCAVVRTDTDINGQVRTINLLERCDKPYHHKPRRRRYSTNYLTPVRHPPDDRRHSQRAYFRGVIATLFASCAEESARGVDLRT